MSKTRGPAHAKTAPETAQSRVPKHGRGRLRIGGKPGNKGGGRPKAEFRDLLVRLRQDPRVHSALRQALTDPASRGFSSALKVLSDYDPDKPAEKKQVSGKLEVRVRVVRESSKRTVG